MLGITIFGMGGISRAINVSPLSKNNFLKEDRRIVIDQKIANVTGNQKKDIITLIGIADSVEDTYYRQLFLAIHDEAKSKYLYFPLNIEGYQPKLTIGDLNGDHVNDIFVSAATGGSGGTYSYSIWSVKGYQAKQIPVPKAVDVSGSFLDNYIAKITVQDINKSYYINMKDRKKFYDQQGIYKGGKLLVPTELLTDYYSSLELTNRDKNGVFQLKGYQRVSGVAHYNSIADVVSLWKWKNGWKLDKLQVVKVE